VSDVAIVGIGMHAFGRHPNSGREQGAIAARRALTDAGITWSAVEYAFGGSSAAGAADTLVSDLGLTGVPFINVANGCATGGSALISAYNALRSGAAEVVMAIGFDKHPRGAFDPLPADYGLGDWTARPA
jgi:acetyl-CoA acetyltransferase